MIHRLLFTCLIVASLAAGCRSPHYADRGALVGGLTGAGLGAAIGDANGNAGAGAIIGSAVGAITGAAIGDGIDEDLARSRAEIEARMGRQMSGAVTPEDAIAMTRAGLSEDVMVTHIRASGVARQPQVNDLIYLRNQGVPDSVIKALQSTPGPQVIAQQAAPARQVVVEHHYNPYYAPPPPLWFHYGRDRHHHHHHRPRGHVGWGFSVGR